MTLQVRTRLAATSVLSFVLLASLATWSFASILLDNDVDIGHANATTLCGPLSVIRCSVVFGAPRLVPPGALGSLEILIESKAGNSIQSVALELLVHDATGTPVCPSLPPGIGSGACPLRLTSSLFERLDPADPTRVQLKFEHFTLPPGESLPPGDLIFTVDGSVTVGTDGPATLPPGAVEITWTRGGNEVVIDRVGDEGSDPGDALDIPPRSMRLVRALSQFAAHPQQRRGVEFDVTGGVDRPVGFTHAFDLRSDAVIKSAALILSVRPANGGFDTDYVLLDEAVRIVASEGLTAEIPVIFLGALPEVPGTPSARRLELQSLRDLEDGQLNVIVGDDTVVNFSQLEIILR